jgi:hypothetical protein
LKNNARAVSNQIEVCKTVDDYGALALLNNIRKDCERRWETWIALWKNIDI